MKYQMSVPDMILQAFVIVMCLWGAYAKFIAPHLAKVKDHNLLLRMLSNAPLQLQQRLEDEIIWVQGKIDRITPLVAAAAITPVIESEAEESQVVAAEEHRIDVIESEEKESEEGMATHEIGDLWELNHPEGDDNEGETEEESDSEDEEDKEDESDEDEESDGVSQPNLSSVPRNNGTNPSTSIANVSTVRRPFQSFLSAKTTHDPFAEWNAFTSNLLGTANHLIVIGASGGGKTFTMYDLVRNLLENNISVIVCDPDAAAGDWPGADVYGGGDDFASINAVLKGLSALMKQRREERTKGIREFEPMWFVFDEYADIKDECELSSTVVENGLRRARKLNIHLMIGVQDTQVKTMGFERKSSLLEHARIVKLIKRLDGSRILRLDEETTMRVPNWNVNPATVSAATIPFDTSDTLEGETPVIDSTRFSFASGTKVPLKSDIEAEWIGDDETGDNDPKERDGKEAIIRQLLLAKPPWSYARIVEHLGTSSARIGRIKNAMRDEGLLE